MMNNNQSRRQRRRSRSRQRDAVVQAPVVVEKVRQVRFRSRSRSRNRQNVMAMPNRQVMVAAPLPRMMQNMSVRNNQRARSGQSVKVQESSRKPIDDYMRDNIRGAGLAGRTYPGCAWMTKALDPCHPTSAVMGIPDRICINTVNPDFEEVFMIDNMSANSGVGYVSNTGSTIVINATATWNLLLLNDAQSMITWGLIYQGSIENPTYGQCFLHSLKGVRQIVGEEANLNGIAKSRLSYMGVTAEFTGSDLNNQGRLVVAQAPAEWAITDDKESAAVPVYVPPAKASLDVTSENFFRTWTLGTPTSSATTDNPSAARLQTFASNLMQVSVRAVSMAAKEGFYAPVYLNDPAFLFKDHKYTVAKLTTFDEPGQHLFYVNPFFSAGRGAYAIPTGGAGGYLQRVADGYDGHCVISHWQGLDPKASIQMTYRYGIECNPEPGGILSAFAKPSPDHDEQALEAYNHIRIKMDDAYPASYNLLDKLWNVIKLVAKATIPHLMGAVPVVGNMLQGMITGAMERYL